MEIRLLAPEEIAAWEGRIRPFIESVCSKSRGRYAPHHILEWARRGEWQIWLVLENERISFVLGTQVVMFPTGMKAIDIRFGTGSGRERWQHRIADNVLAWAKAQGCGMAEGVFRRGWRRVLPGWNHTHDFLERAL